MAPKNDFIKSISSRLIVVRRVMGLYQMRGNNKWISKISQSKIIAMRRTNKMPKKNSTKSTC